MIVEEGVCPWCYGQVAFGRDDDTAPCPACKRECDVTWDGDAGGNAWQFLTCPVCYWGPCECVTAPAIPAPSP